jgi:hypothetical protein
VVDLDEEIRENFAREKTTFDMIKTQRMMENVLCIQVF